MGTRWRFGEFVVENRQWKPYQFYIGGTWPRGSIFDRDRLLAGATDG